MMTTLHNPSALWSLAVLCGGAAALIFFVLRFAHANLTASNLAELDRMRVEGILVGEVRNDYATLTYLIDTVAPAVALAPESWVRLYWMMLAILRALPLRRWVERQTKLLAAYQATRYRVAVNRLQEMRA